MKKSIILAVAGMFLFASLAFAFVWEHTNQLTVAWDLVSDATSYAVYLKKPGDPDPAEALDTTTDTKYTFTFTVEGKYIVGVQSIKEIEDMKAVSSISWSDNPDVCKDGIDFGAMYINPPGEATGLRKSQEQ